MIIVMIMKDQVRLTLIGSKSFIVNDENVFIIVMTIIMIVIIVITIIIIIIF